MKKNKIGASIVETIVVMVIVVIGVVGMYNIYNNSLNLSDTTIQRLQALSIAREGIEATTNIRDTNWLLFSSNYDNCFMTYNYDGSCIVFDNKFTQTGSYIVYKNSVDKWILEKKDNYNGDFKTDEYKKNFRVNIGADGFFTQSGGTNFNPLFTREIKISYPSDAGTPPQKVKVESLVKWTNSGRNGGNYEVKLENILTNWKRF